MIILKAFFQDNNRVQRIKGLVLLNTKLASFIHIKNNKGDGELVTMEMLHLEAVVTRCSSKWVFVRFQNFHRKTPVLESLFNKVPDPQTSNFI